MNLYESKMASQHESSWKFWSRHEPIPYAQWRVEKIKELQALAAEKNQGGEDDDDAGGAGEKWIPEVIDMVIWS